MMAEMALIQAVSMAIQAASAPPVVSSAMGTSATGGLLQSPVPTHGYVHCTTTTTVSTGTSSVETSAFLLVASGIKNFKL